ncbi:hypothetical protein GQ44DRAFT_569872, partial [Phaeosphaeriaceae sp. PMI808]
MGIVSSKVSQPPLPEFSIQLSTPANKVFRPNEVVTGSIILTTTTPISPRSIEVSLFGKSLIWYRAAVPSPYGGESGFRHWRDNALLFESTTYLLPATSSPTPALLERTTYTYPFSLRFPVATENHRISYYERDKKKQWTTGPHDLPPSFRSNERCANYARIEYSVCAKLV